ncbi:MAG: hypothetical protein ACREP7_15400, partial [Lysobacter sp.]
MERILPLNAAASRLRPARCPLAAAAVACLVAAAPLAAGAQDRATSAEKPALRALEQPVFARMLRSPDLKPLLTLTSAGAQPLDTHEAKLDLR